MFIVVERLKKIQTNHKNGKLLYLLFLYNHQSVGMCYEYFKHTFHTSEDEYCIRYRKTAYFVPVTLV